MTGENLPFLCIGKSKKKPRCFKGTDKLPIIYLSNNKAWMTADIFAYWLRKLYRIMHLQSRKIAVVSDNSQANPKGVQGLSNIELVFLPMKTNLSTQPMDQGVISNLELEYRCLLVQKNPRRSLVQCAKQHHISQSAVHV